MFRGLLVAGLNTLMAGLGVTWVEIFRVEEVFRLFYVVLTSQKYAALVLMMLVFVVKVNPLEFIWGLFSGIVVFRDI